MKTILVDAINGYVLEDGSVNHEMYEMLERFPNQKIVLTGANDEQFKQFHLDELTYPVFTQKHDPEKTDPEYWKRLFREYNLTADDVVYFEHSPEATETAKSIGVPTYFYDPKTSDIVALRAFLESNL